VIVTAHLPAPEPDDADAAAEASERAERPSRSARKRNAVRLTRLTPTRLARLGLPDELREAVLEAQRLRSRAALARQRQYIGRLMRGLDPAPIEHALAGESSANDRMRR